MFVFSLWIPAEQNTRENARGVCCLSHLHLIANATHSYIAEHGSLPVYTIDKNGKPLHSWRVLLLPYFEKLPNYCQDDCGTSPTELYQQIRQDEPWDSEHNQTFYKKAAYFYRCPNRHLTEDDKNCQYIRIDSGSGWAVVDAGQSFCWMNPLADIPFDDLLKNAEAMKDKDTENEQANRLYYRHWIVSWWWKVPVVNIFLSDGKSAQIKECNLAEELNRFVGKKTSE